jgi:hypothetical protein
VIPDTLTAVLIIVLGILPGLPGDKVYRAMAGVSWREKDTQHGIRLLSFSAAGLAVYASVAAPFGWPMPSYIVPNTYSAETFSASVIPTLGGAYLGHVAGATLAGLTAAGLRLGLAKVLTSGVHNDAWDQFVNKSTPKHWVLIHLTSGEIYSGILDHADVAVEPEYRDIILSEPAIYEDDQARYVSTSHQHLFIPGSAIASMATVYDPTCDQDRVVQPGAVLFGTQPDRGNDD